MLFDQRSSQIIVSAYGSLKNAQMLLMHIAIGGID
jgi:hypothetical protein